VRGVRLSIHVTVAVFGDDLVEQARFDARVIVTGTFSLGLASFS